MASKQVNAVTSDAMRKNKVIECFKNLFSNQDCFILPPFQDDNLQSEVARTCGQIKKQIGYKKVCGKPLNGKMLLSLALEYAETLSL